MVCGSRYRLTEVRERDGSIRQVPYVLAVKMRDMHGAEIIGEVPSMAEKEMLVQKKDGSFHQLPASIAEELVKNGEATIPDSKKVSTEEEKEKEEEEEEEEEESEKEEEKSSRKVTKKKKKS